MGTTTIQDDWSVPEDYIKMSNPMANVMDNSGVGKTLFTKHCKLCHGAEGKGDGIMAENLDKEVANFSKPEIQVQTDGALYYKFLNGKDEMPAFKDKIIKEKERWLLVNYLRKLGRQN